MVESAPVSASLEAARDAACTSPDLGPSRARQLNWVAGEMVAYAALLPREQRPHDAAGWFAQSFVDGYLLSADSGALRQRAADDRPSPDATRRVRRRCVRLLAEAARRPAPEMDLVPLPDTRPRAEQRTADLAVAHWTGRADPVSAKPGEVRTAAMAALIHEAGLRSGELAALSPGDLDLAGGTLTYQPRPPAARLLPPPRTVRLSSRTVRTLRHWLQVRAELTEQTPRTRTLWVSLAGNHDGYGVRRPAGMPLQPTGLRRAYRRAVAAANVQLAGAPGFSPLPRTAGRLRGPDDTTADSTDPG